LSGLQKFCEHGSRLRRYSTPNLFVHPQIPFGFGVGFFQIFFMSIEMLPVVWKVSGCVSDASGFCRSASRTRFLMSSLYPPASEPGKMDREDQESSIDEGEIEAVNGPPTISYVDEAVPARGGNIALGRRKIAPLTGIRIFAALAVLGYHFALQHPQLPAILRPMRTGFIGVNLFFVLSGFILVYNYYGKQTGYRKFYWNRLIRIYPTYFLALVFGLCVMPTPFDGQQFYLEAFLVHGWIPGHACGINCPDWSISAEAFFYAAFPFLIVIAERISLRGLILGACAAWALSLIPAIYVARLESLYGGAAVSQIFDFLCYHPALNASQFIVGLVTGVCFLRRSQAIERYRRQLFWTVVLLAAAFIVWIEIDPPASEAYMRLGLLSPFFALLILYVACGDSLLAAFLALPPIVLLGEASYAVYLYQTPIARSFHHVAPNMVGAVLTLALLVVLSILSYLYFEKPVRYWLRRISSARFSTAA
jgi:peptidoglycan/LPS O-acetylase OafA/YrhL